MKRSAMLLLSFSLALLICGTAEAKRWRQRGCCQFYQSSPAYCLQYPLYEDPNATPPLTFYNYDRYDGCPSPGNWTANNYGWVASGTPSPQSCGVDNDCLANPPMDRCYDTQTGTFRDGHHQLKKKIQSSDELADVLPADAIFKDTTGKEWHWNPRLGLPEHPDKGHLHKVQAREGHIPVKLFHARVDFRKAAAAATPPIPPNLIDDKFGVGKPVQHDVHFGIEVDDAAVGGPSEAIVARILNAHSAIVRDPSQGGQLTTIITNSDLQ